MEFTRSVENVELHQSRAWRHAVLRASEARCKNIWKKKPTRGVSEQTRDINKIDTQQSTRRPIRAQHVEVRALKRVETIVTREWKR